MEHVDLAFQSSLKEVMEDEYSLLLETFLSDSKLRLEQIQEAVTASDSEALRKAAHSFKGSASNIGAPQLTELCKQAEDMGREGQLELASEMASRIETEYSEVAVALSQILNN